MRLLILAGLLVGTACSVGESRSTKTTDTTVTPTRATDTTVVEKKVDVNVDTVKKTHNKKH